jgi:hypothetical protein
MNGAHRILLSEPEGEFGDLPVVKFRLIYDGPLQPSQRDPENGAADPIALHKHKIRTVFHGQLKRLWETNRFLSSAECDAWAEFRIGEPANFMTPLKDVLGLVYQRNGFNFVPLAIPDYDLLCNLDILFLRRDAPGSIIQAGDIDNRIKTLIDALRIPKGANELGGCPEPCGDQSPFFCLLEDDKQVTGLKVETDTLLDPTELNDADNRRVRLVISVEITPYHRTSTNAGFA